MPRPRVPVFVLALCAGVPVAAAAQTPRLGAEVRGYPAGVIPTVRMETRVSERFDLHLSGGFNLTDRRGYGEHDDEKGNGFGAGAGLTARPAAGRKGWIWGVRTELWNLSIDWEDQGRAPGSTDVLVLQPTGRVGYRWPVGGAAGSVEAAASLGMEINVRTRGEKVGEGPILLIGIAWIHGM